MNSINTATAFFGWCTVINIGIYLLTIIGVTVFRGLLVRVNIRIFSISEEDIMKMSFQYLGHYKLAITVLCFVPYVAFRLMS